MQILASLLSRSGSLRLAYGALAVIDGVSGVFTIAAAAGGNYLWWGVFAALVVGFFFLLSVASAKEQLALLYRRSIRKGKVDRYNRAARRPTWPADFSCDGSAGSVAEDPEAMDRQPYWYAEERFENRLRAYGSQHPGFIETPHEDEVILLVEGKLVREVIDVEILLFPSDVPGND